MGFVMVINAQNRAEQYGCAEIAKCSGGIRPLPDVSRGLTVVSLLAIHEVERIFDNEFFGHLLIFVKNTVAVFVFLPAPRLTWTSRLSVFWQWMRSCQPMDTHRTVAITNAMIAAKIVTVRKGKADSPFASR